MPTSTTTQKRARGTGKKDRVFFRERRDRQREDSEET